MPAPPRDPASSPSVFAIEPPPRRVPGGIRRKLLFGGALNQMSWFFFGVGLIFFWIFVLDSEIWSYALFAGETGQTSGLVTAVNETNSSENERRIVAVDYAYSVDRVEHRGTSYTTRSAPGTGAVVDIEYREDRPHVSRIRGMRRYRFSALASVSVGFPLIGLILAMRGLWRGRRDLHVLTHGRAAMGTLVSRERSGVKVNNQHVYNLAFRYRTDAGNEHQGVVSTLNTQPLEDEAEERLLYDPARPARIVAMDNLPGGTRIDEQGRLTGGGSGLHVLLLPVLSVSAVIAMSIFW